MSVSFVLEALVVLGCIVMGTRAGGVGVGLWGGLGTFVLVFVFGEAPGEPPAAAVAIILAVVTPAAMMQAAGGIDWMVAMAARIIEKRPKQITLIAPLTAFLFCIGAGTGNIIYPLLPVIYDVSYKNRIRPSRPLTVTVVQSGIALAASPVSAAMAAMLTLTDVAPYNLGPRPDPRDHVPRLRRRHHRDLAGGQPDVEGPRRRPRGPGARSPPASCARAARRPSARASRPPPSSPSPRRGRNSALAFLLGVVAIVIFGLFPDLRPSFTVDGETVPVDMTTTIVLVMFVVGVIILFLGRPT